MAINVLHRSVGDREGVLVVARARVFKGEDFYKYTVICEEILRS